MTVLVVGASGMLGGAIYQTLAAHMNDQIFGVARSKSVVPESFNNSRIIRVDDIFDQKALLDVIQKFEVNCIINAIGIIKQIRGPKYNVEAIRLNAILPHYLSDIAAETGCRLVLVSTDCVFSGNRGMYTEADTPDATDLYGRSKLLGEIADKKHVLTIRTSIIGHESGRAASLVDWALSQKGKILGYTEAYFSGVPTVYLAKLLMDHLVLDDGLWGLWHVSAERISKYDLLDLISQKYGVNFELIPDSDVQIDRSLDSTKFREISGFVPESWPKLITLMYDNKVKWERS